MQELQGHGVSNKLLKEGMGAQAVCSRAMVCLGYFTVATAKHYDHKQLGEDIFQLATLRSHPIAEGSQGRKLR